MLQDTHTRTIRSCSWSPNGTCLACAGFDAIVSIWELQVRPMASALAHRDLYAAISVTPSCESYNAS